MQTITLFILACYALQGYASVIRRQNISPPTTGSCADTCSDFSSYLNSTCSGSQEESTACLCGDEYSSGLQTCYECLISQDPQDYTESMLTDALNNAQNACGGNSSTSNGGSDSSSTATDGGDDSATTSFAAISITSHATSSLSGSHASPVVHTVAQPQPQPAAAKPSTSVHPTPSSVKTTYNSSAPAGMTISFGLVGMIGSLLVAAGTAFVLL